MLSVHYRTTLPAIPPERSHAKHTLFLLAQISCISFAIGANPFVLFDYWRKWLMSLFAIGLCHGKHTLFLLAQIACISIAIGAAMGSILSSYWPKYLASLSLLVLPRQTYYLPIGPNNLNLFRYWCCHGKHILFLLAQIIWISFTIGAAMANILSSY